MLRLDRNALAADGLGACARRCHRACFAVKQFRYRCAGRTRGGSSAAPPIARPRLLRARIARRDGGDVQFCRLRRPVRRDPDRRPHPEPSGSGGRSTPRAGPPARRWPPRASRCRRRWRGTSNHRRRRCGVDDVGMPAGGDLLVGDAEGRVQDRAGRYAGEDALALHQLAGAGWRPRGRRRTGSPAGRRRGARDEASSMLRSPYTSSSYRGSAAITCTSGLCSRRNRETPISVPVVPRPATKRVIDGRSARISSGPVPS